MLTDQNSTQMTAYFSATERVFCIAGCKTFNQAVELLKILKFLPETKEKLLEEIKELISAHPEIASLREAKRRGNLGR